MIVQILGLITSYIMLLFFMLIESLFFALPAWYGYNYINNKIGLSDLNYIEIMLILLLIKIIRFSSVEIMKLFNSSHSLKEQKSSDSY